MLKKLPEVRGRLTYNAPLGHMTWFGVGGAAEVLFKPADRQDLIDFVKNCPQDIPVTVIGVASNLIIRDGGIPGVVIRLGREFAEVNINGTEVTAGAAALDMNVALACLKQSVAGLEFLSGIPGTIGGALRMNAGAYGRETKDALMYAEVLFRDGTVRSHLNSYQGRNDPVRFPHLNLYQGRNGPVKEMTPAEMEMSYRHNSLPETVVFLGGTFKGAVGDAAAIEEKMSDIKTKRAATQPIKSKTGGSTFANPPQGSPANPEGHKAWQLIDAAGCRGLKIGGAQMSEMHANFMINTGTATAADLERLGEEVRKRVLEHSGVELRWEIKRIGRALT